MHEPDSNYVKALEAQKRGDHHTALALITKRAHKSSYCAWWLSQCYYHGYWVPLNMDKYNEYHSIAMELNNPRALMSAAIVEQYNFEKIALELADRAMEKAQLYKDYYVMGMYYSDGPRQKDRSDELAVLYYKKAAEQGDPFAQNRLGNLFLNWHENIEKAARWFQMAIENGCAKSMWEQAYMLRHYTEVEDKSHMMSLYRKSAEQECQNAQSELIDIYIDDKLYVPALYWIKRIEKIDPVKSTIRRNQYSDIFDKIERCQCGVHTILMIWQFRHSVLGRLPRDIVLDIAKKLWSMKFDQINKK